jgi:hypothetical protein
MTKSELNARTKRAFKTFKIHMVTQPSQDKVNTLYEELESIVSCGGGIALLSKDNILKIVRMQSHLKFMPEHRFFMYFVIATEDLKF